MLEKSNICERRTEMIKRTKTERRLYPRLFQQLPVKIGANGYDFTTTTHNVSCTGTYCCVSKYIPPFTKIAVRLCLPHASKDANNNCNVECKGVVVRSEDGDNGGFNIAIFFNDIKQNERKKISHYVNQFLTQTPS